MWCAVSRKSSPRLNGAKQGLFMLCLPSRSDLHKITPMAMHRERSSGSCLGSSVSDTSVVNFGHGPR